MLVLRAVVDEEEDASCREALKQAVEDCLGLRIDPVQILEDETEGLALALPERQVLDGIQGPLAALRWLERLPLRVLDWHPEQGEEGRQGRLEGRIEGEQLVGQLLPDLLPVVLGFD